MISTSTQIKEHIAERKSWTKKGGVMGYTLPKATRTPDNSVYLSYALIIGIGGFVHYSIVNDYSTRNLTLMTRFYWPSMVSGTLFILTLWSLRVASITDNSVKAYLGHHGACQRPPSLPPPFCAHSCERCEKEESRNVRVDDNQNNKPIWKPPRAYHCKICKTCTFHMDHHCPWIGNCVGYFNRRFFFLFLTHCALFSIFTALMYIDYYLKADNTVNKFTLFYHVLPTLLGLLPTIGQMTEAYNYLSYDLTQIDDIKGVKGFGNINQLLKPKITYINFGAVMRMLAYTQLNWVKKLMGMPLVPKKKKPWFDHLLQRYYEVHGWSIFPYSVPLFYNFAEAVQNTKIGGCCGGRKNKKDDRICFLTDCEGPYYYAPSVVNEVSELDLFDPLYDILEDTLKGQEVAIDVWSTGIFHYERAPAYWQEEDDDFDQEIFEEPKCEAEANFFEQQRKTSFEIKIGDFSLFTKYENYLILFNSIKI